MTESIPQLSFSTLTFFFNNNFFKGDLLGIIIYNCSSTVFKDSFPIKKLKK